MSLAMPGSHGCFSFLQHTLKPGAKQVKITPSVRDQLQDFLWLAESLVNCPTYIAKVVPMPALYHGTIHASGKGMCGICFPADSDPEPLTIRPPRRCHLNQPLLWGACFPSEDNSKLVTFQNPKGTITNSDLELAGTIAHNDVLSQEVPVDHISRHTFCDNTPAVTWRNKGNATTAGPAIYLLQLSALHRRHYHYKSFLLHLPGDLNVMADDCSCLWNFTDSELLTYFNSHYPQETLWQLIHLRPEMHSALTSSFLCKRSKPESYLQQAKRLTTRGIGGVHFAPPTMLTRTFHRWSTLSHCLISLASDGVTGKLRPVVSPTGLALWKTQFTLSARNFLQWGP